MLNLAIRLGLLGFAAVALTVAGQVLPTARDVDRERHLVRRILAREPLPEDRVTAAFDKLAQRGGLRECRPEGSEQAAILAAWLADFSETKGDLALLDKRVNTAVASARHAINCDPASAFPWLALAKFRIVTEGVDRKSLEAIRFTWEIAPRESWIMTSRATILFSIRRWLAATEIARLLDDMAKLVASEVISEVVVLMRTSELAEQQDMARRVALLPYAVQRRYQYEAIRLGVDVRDLAIPRSASDPNWAKSR